MPPQPVGDAVHVRVHSYPSDCAPGHVHDQVCHLGANTGERDLPSMSGEWREVGGIEG